MSVNAVTQPILAGHGLKDLGQHRSQFVANTRWWPPFCLAADWAVAAIIAVEIVAGVQFTTKRLGIAGAHSSQNSPAWVRSCNWRSPFMGEIRKVAVLQAIRMSL